MMRIFKVAPFFFLLLSAVSFSLATLASRLFIPEKLPVVIDFQSTSVFIVFILQMGLRTGIRLHFHSGYQLTVEKVYNYLNIKTLLYAIPLTILAGFFHNKFYFSFCFLQAILSFNQGLFVARKEYSRVAVSSVMIFSHILLSILVILLISEKQHTFLLIEISSLVLLIFMPQIFVRSDSYSKRATYLLIKKYFPLQIGSLVVYGAMYLFAQCVIKYGAINNEILLAYADATIIAGGILLLVGKGMMFLEGRIIQEKKFLLSLGGYLTFVFVFVLIYSGFTSTFMGYSAYWASASMLFLLGRFAFSYVSQFANPKSRIVLYGIGCFVTMILLMFNYLDMSYTQYKVGAIFFNFVFVVFIYLLIYRFNSKKMFIH